MPALVQSLCRPALQARQVPSWPPCQPRPTRSPKRPIRIQESFLFESLKENRPVVVALLTGKIIQGRIVRFDRFSVMVNDGTHEVLIYKQAISCIARAS